MSAANKRKADKEVKRLEGWNDRFFKRAIVFLLFGRRQMRGGSIADDSHELAALRKVEQHRDAFDDSLSKRAKPRKLLFDHPETTEMRVRLQCSSMWTCRPSASDSQTFSRP